MSDLNDQERAAAEEFRANRYGAKAPEVSAFRAGYRAAVAARGEPQYGYHLRPWETYSSAHSRPVVGFMYGWLYTDELPKPSYPAREPSVEGLADGHDAHWWRQHWIERNETVEGLRAALAAREDTKRPDEPLPALDSLSPGERAEAHAALRRARHVLHTEQEHER